MSRSCLVVVVALCASAPRGAAAPPASALPSPRDGTYRYIEGRAGARRVEREIVRVAADMLFIVRGFVRSRLRAANRVARRIVLARRGDTITVRFDKRTYRARLGAKARMVVGSAGDRLAHSIRQRGNALVQRFVGSRGTRINRLAPAGGDRLVLDVTITSPKLPTDVRYHLLYRRVR